METMTQPWLPSNRIFRSTEMWLPADHDKWLWLISTNASIIHVTLLMPRNVKVSLSMHGRLTWRDLIWCWNSKLLNSIDICLSSIGQAKLKNDCKYTKVEKRNIRTNLACCPQKHFRVYRPVKLISLVELNQLKLLLQHHLRWNSKYVSWVQCLKNQLRTF